MHHLKCGRYADAGHVADVDGRLSDQDALCILSSIGIQGSARIKGQGLWGQHIGHMDDHAAPGPVRGMHLLPSGVDWLCAQPTA